jgi:hypothetical protein
VKSYREILTKMLLESKLSFKLADILPWFCISLRSSGMAFLITNWSVVTFAWVKTIRSELTRLR